MSAERAAEARKKADQLACVAWNMRMLGYKGPAQPSPTLGDALSAGCAASAATHTQHSFAGDRQASQDDACVWARAVPSMQGLLSGPQVSLQAQLPRRAEA
jgi:hypothetical protein